MKIIDLLSGVFYGIDASVDTAVDFIIHSCYIGQTSFQFNESPNELVNCERDY